MPTLPTTQHIPKQEWEKRKGRIVDLYLTHGVKLLGHDGVIETMAKEGFTATKSQYELQFRQWGLHKYMRRHELDRVIQERKQRRQRGDPTPITFAGKAIPNSRIDRAERLLMRQKGQHNETALLDDDNVAQENTSPQIPTVEPYNSATINTVNHAEAQGIDQVVQPSDLANDVIGMSFHDTFGASAYMDNAGTTDLATFDFSVQKSYDLTLEPSSLPGDGQLFVESIDSQFLSGNAMNIDESPFSLPPYLDAPFDPGAGVELTSCTLPNSIAGLHWHRETRSKGHQITLPSGMIVAKIMEEIYSKNRTTDAVSQPNLNLACQFSTDINTRPCSNTFTPAPRYLFATQIFIGEEHYQFTKLPNDVACEARLNTRLITSVVNGFSGLQSVPAAGVLTFLNRRQDTQLLMVEFLCSNSNPVARSLAENIFQAALQADNVGILNYLLDHSDFVDANETVCLYKGLRYTPLELATIHHSVRVVLALIKRNVDINKSLQGSHYNALSLLILKVDKRSTLDESFLGLVDALLEAGITIRARYIQDALYFTDARLATRLIEKCASQTPQELITDTALVNNIVISVKEKSATTMIRLIIQKCQERDADQNYRQFLLDIGKYVVRDAVERGYKEVVEILLPYVPSPSLILQIAKKTGKQSIIDLILQNYPDLDDGTEGLSALVVALESGNQKRLRSLEDMNVLKRLQGRNELGQALTAALRVGNLEYATKILDVDPDFSFAYSERHGDIDEDLFDPAASLGAALTHGFDDIAWKILAFGSTVYESSRMSLLYVTITNRKPELVKAIIESGFDSNIRQYVIRPCKHQSVLEAALEWDDDSILQDIWQYHPRDQIVPNNRLLKLALEKGREDLFFDILKFHPLIDRRFEKRWDALQVAIECENIPVLDQLITIDVSVVNHDILEMTMHEHPSIVKPLLEAYRRASSRTAPRYYYDLLNETILKYPGSSKLIDLFFDFNLITMAAVDIHQGEEYETPLTAAIRRFASNKGGVICIPLIKRLLNAGSDVNSTVGPDYSDGSCAKSTVLLLAIGTKNMEIIKLLVDRGADINKPALFGIPWTPLQKAAELDNIEIASYLLAKGADVNAPPATFTGATALQFAAIGGRCEMAAMLIEHGARLDIRPPIGLHGRWPLEGAAENGRLDMIRYLWKANGGPFDEKQCQNAMRLAEKNGYLGCRDYIRELMNNPNSGLSMLGAE